MQLLQHAAVNVFQGLDVGHGHAFVDFVDGGIARAQLNHLRAHLSDEATIAGAAGGGEFGLDAGFITDGGLHRAHQVATRGQKGQATDGPAQVVLQAMLIQHGFEALLQVLGGGLGAKAKVEVNHASAWNHVARACACVDVADLPTSGREKFVAGVPFDRHQLGQSRCQPMDRIFGQLRVGDVTLHTLHRELAAHAATAPVFDHVARALHRGGFAHDAPVQTFTPGFQGLADLDRAVQRRAFFIAGEQEGDVDQRRWLRGHKLFTRHHHGGQRRFHVAAATAIQHAIAVGGGERVVGPLLNWPGGHYIGVTGKHQGFGVRLCAASNRPQVAHPKALGPAVEALTGKT